MQLFSYVKRNFRNSRRTAILLLLCIATVVNAAVLFISLRTSHEAYAENLYGKYDYCAFPPDEKAAPSDGGATGILRNYGLIGWEDSVWVLGTAEESTLSVLPIKVIAGRLPETENEIVMEEAVSFLMGAEVSENPTAIRYLCPDGSEKIGSFSIVGIISNYTKGTPEDGENPFGRFPNILSGTLPEKVPEADILLFSSVSYSALRAEGWLGQIYENTGKNSSDAAIFRAVSTGICVLLAVLGIVLMTAAIFLENNAAKKRLFLYKSAGGSIPGYLKMHFGEFLLWDGSAFLLGMLLGLSLSAVMVLLLKKYVAEWVCIRLSVIAWLVVPGIVFALFGGISLAADVKRCGVSPLLLMQPKQKARSVSHIGAKKFARHPVFVQSLRNVVCNSTDYVSLILCFFVLFSVFAVLQVGSAAVSKYFEEESEFDYTLYAEDGIVFSVFSIPDGNSSFSAYEMTALEQCEELRQCFGLSKNKMFILGESERDQELLPFLADDLKKGYRYSEAALSHAEDEYELFGYARDDCLYSVNLVGASRDVLEELSAGGEPAQGVTLVVRDSELPCYSVGDVITFTAPRKNEKGQVERIDLPLPVGQIEYLKTDSPLYDLFGGTPVSFVVPQETVKNQLANGLNSLYLHLKSPEVFEDTENILKQISAIHSHDTIWSMESKREENAERRNLQYILTSVAGLVASIMAVYILTSVLLVLKQDLYGKREIWGYLRAGSMNETQAFANEIFTVLLCLFVGFILFCMIALIFLFGSGAEDALTLLSLCSPWAVVIPGGVAVIVCLCLTRMAIRKFWRVSVCQLIHAEE